MHAKNTNMPIFVGDWILLKCLEYPKGVIAKVTFAAIMLCIDAGDEPMKQISNVPEPDILVLSGIRHADNQYLMIEPHDGLPSGALLRYKGLVTGDVFKKVYEEVTTAQSVVLSGTEVMLVLDKTARITAPIAWCFQQYLQHRPIEERLQPLKMISVETLLKLYLSKSFAVKKGES